MKQCPKCKEEKSFNEFYKDKRNKDGVRVYCKDCTKLKQKENYYKNLEQKRETSRKYQQENKELISEKRKKHYRENKELYKERRKKSYQKFKDRELKQNREWNKKNKEKIKEYNKQYKSTKEFREYENKYQRERYANDSTYRLSRLVRNFCRRVTDAVKQDKELRSLEYLGCSLEEFKSHIESLWLDGMSWDNHGDWHIDHKVPLDWYVKNSDDPWEANHYTNLQPLWAAENLSKGSSI